MTSRADTPGRDPARCTFPVTLCSPAHATEDRRPRRRTVSRCTTPPPELRPPRREKQRPGPLPAPAAPGHGRDGRRLRGAATSTWTASVAVKRVPVDSHGPDDKAGKRAAREALAAARLGHPAIVAIYEAGLRRRRLGPRRRSSVRGTDAAPSSARRRPVGPGRPAHRRHAVRRAVPRPCARRGAPRREAVERGLPEAARRRSRRSEAHGLRHRAPR